MQSDSSSLDTLKDNLLRAVDAEYNVLKAEIVLDIICQLENMTITKNQLQKTRLGREINTIRQKIDAKKKLVQHADKSPELIIEIAQRAKKLLRSWQGLLNTSQKDSLSACTDGEMKPRLILKVKFHSSQTKRKHEFDNHLIAEASIKRKKVKIMKTAISPSLPHLKTTEELFMEMQRNEAETFSVSHHGNNVDHTNSACLSSSNNICQIPGSSSQCPLSSTCLSSTFVSMRNSNSTTSCLASTYLPVLSEGNQFVKDDRPSIKSTTPEQLNSFAPDLATMRTPYTTLADLIQDHRRRILATHDSQELQARPDLLLVPIEQLAVVYERERTTKCSELSHFKYSSITSSEKLPQPSDFIALPFIDCPLEFDFTLDEFVVEQPTLTS
ncbi:unnamed protein product [Adineta ricciae]|uniref:TFIIS N-terminal domain-containing protein n=1 Tax=Adineta ricciae TaxID=249248 RepID=A0A814K9T7_ADIRI|nr:unnamed protein product [Adineta ricciae]